MFHKLKSLGLCQTASWQCLELNLVHATPINKIIENHDLENMTQIVTTGLLIYLHKSVTGLMSLTSSN